MRKSAQFSIAVYLDLYVTVIPVTMSNTGNQSTWGPAAKLFFVLSEFFFFFFLIFGCVGSSFLCEGFSLAAASGGHSSSWCAGLSPSRPLSLRSTGSRCAGSVIVAHGPICSVAYGIFPDQGSNLCPLHWQADSQPLHHQGSPSVSSYGVFILNAICFLSYSPGSQKAQENIKWCRYRYFIFSCYNKSSSW